MRIKPEEKMKFIQMRNTSIEKKRKIKCSACEEISDESDVVIDVLNYYVYCPRCWKSHLEIEKIIKGRHKN